MEKSKIQRSLEKIMQEASPDLYNFNGDNHDQVNTGIGLLNAESAEKTAKSMENLSANVSGLTYVLSTTIEQQTKKILASNDEVFKVSRKAVFWSKWLTIALILTTFTVGLLQAIVIYSSAHNG